MQSLFGVDQQKRRLTESERGIREGCQNSLKSEEGIRILLVELVN